MALKNVPDSSTKLIKTPIGKAGGAKRESAGRSRPPPDSAGSAERDRGRRASGDDRAAAPRPQHGKRKHPDGGRSHGEPPGEGARSARSECIDVLLTLDSAGEKKEKRDESAVLRGVVFALSGYVNPQRAALRDTGLRLGARYRPAVGADCTHLV